MENVHSYQIKNCKKPGMLYDDFELTKKVEIFLQAIEYF